MKKKNGITLIALIITIIVLLILAGVTISLVVGDNGILQKSTTAKLTMEVEQEKELIGISYSAVKARKLAQGDTSNIKGAELDVQLQDDGAGARASGTSWCRCFFGSNQNCFGAERRAGSIGSWIQNSGVSQALRVLKALS